MSRTDIDFKIGADLKQFRSGMQNIDHSLKKLSGGFGALGATIGASFAVDMIRDFAMESINLAAQMEGVEAAFNRLNQPGLLDQLRRATGGTVDDLKLMQTAVRAENFRIPMDTLAKGLEFAQRRAQATGESVDYMVDSFVTGLGRESVKILDNLGISTIELNAKTKEMGSMAAAVGAIMDEEFAKAGERVVTTSMKIDQQRAALTNLKTEIGEKLAPIYASFLDATIKDLSTINILMNSEVGNRDKAVIALKEYLRLSGKESTALGMIFNLAVKKMELERAIEKKQAENQVTLEDYRNAQKQFEADQALAEEKKKEALEAYEDKLNEVLPAIRAANKEVQDMFAFSDFSNLGASLGTDEAIYNLEQLDETTEESTDTFDHSFRKRMETLRQFGDEIMAIGSIMQQSFEAALGPLQEGETRIMKFREVFVQELKQMAAQLLATAAAAALLSAILTVAFGGSNMAGQALFGKAGMGFSDLFGGLFQGMGGGFGFSGANLGGGQGGFGNIVGVVQGADLLLINERASRNRSRQRGY